MLRDGYVSRRRFILPSCCCFFLFVYVQTHSLILFGPSEASDPPGWGVGRGANYPVSHPSHKRTLVTKTVTAITCYIQKSQLSKFWLVFLRLASNQCDLSLLFLRVLVVSLGYYFLLTSKNDC